MNAGEAKDFMVFCSVLNIYRSVGIRPYCVKFKNK
nr:MAG TPA: Kinetochore protein [Caudoviricetes sp.]